MTTIPTSGKITHDGETMTIVGPQGFDALILRGGNGQLVTIAIEDLLAAQSKQKPFGIQVDRVRLGKVPAYRKAFEPLILAGRRTKVEVEKAGAAVGIKASAAYLALARYDLSGDFNDLPPPTRPGGRNKSRLAPKAQAIIEAAVDEILLTRRQHRVALFMSTVSERLRKAGLKVSVTTLRERVAAVPNAEWVGKRKGYKEVRRTLDPHKGDAPTGSRPLEMVQIDHWKTDLELLSEDRLSVIGRAWLTLAIDVYTRIVWGWHLGLDAPGSVPTAFCMIRGMTRKEGFVRSLGLSAHMPFWGTPAALHLDNAGEFRGKTMASGCTHFNIVLTFRPVESPQFGAHIERLNGTLAGKFKDLPGATGATTAERKAFRPDVTAALTFDDLQKQIVMIFDEYHNTPHAGIGNTTPLAKWTNHFLHPDGRPKRQQPPIVVDDLALRIQWYPGAKRTLQAYGILVAFIEYYNEEIEQLVRNRKDYGRVEVRHNPLDVREIYVLHPTRLEWLIVPCRYFSFPAATLKELRDSRREAKRLGREPTPENLARIIEDRWDHIESAKKKTKSAARQATLNANNDRMRAKAPKGPGDVGGDEPIEILPPVAKRSNAPTQRPTQPSSGRGMQVDEDDFAGAAGAIAARRRAREGDGR